MHRWQHTIFMVAAIIILAGAPTFSQEDTAKLEALQKELTQAKADLHTVQSQHAQELAALKAAHKAALNDGQQELAAARKNLDALKGENAQWRIKHAAATEEATTAQMALTQLQQQVEAQQEELTQLRAQYHEAIQHVTTLEAQQTNLQTESAARVGELAAVQQRLVQTQAESSQWQAKHTEAAQALASTQARLQALQKTLAQTLAQSTDWHTKHIEASQALATTQARLQTLQSDMDRIHQARSQQDAQRQQAAAHLQMLSAHTSKLLQDMMQPDSLLVEQQADRLLIRMGASAVYWAGTASLTRESKQVLQALAGLLKEFPDHGVRIVGHTDPLPINRKYRRLWPTNWELSTARAAAVARHLERHDVSPERLSITGFSYHWPLASNDTPEGRRQNRRVEIAVVPPVKK
jgi:chemotaxis protein MotB